MNSGGSPICSWQIPDANSGPATAITASPGTVTVVVGANGSGKSALGHWLEVNAADVDIRRLVAHRRIWLPSSSPEIVPSSRQDLASQVTSWSKQPESRWRDHAQDYRTGILLLDLLAKINERNARQSALVDAGAPLERVRAEVEPSLLTRLNGVLHRADLGVELVVADDGGLDAISQKGEAQFPISLMSDGEKNAVLLAAEVLIAPPGCVQIVDEPERHLHRSISSGIFEALIAERADCHFVVMTHDLDLAVLLARGAEQTIVVSGCVWAGDSVAGWTLHRVDTNAEIPESVRAAILGGRDKLLFVEGDVHSLDALLYAVLFPGFKVCPTGSCEQVIRAVTGLRGSDSYHWVSARGIVDLDGRGEAERIALRDKGILVLSVHEIENLYYLSFVIEAVAKQQAERLEHTWDAMLGEFQDNAMKALSANGAPERFASAVAAQTLTRQAAARLPKAPDLAEGSNTVSIELDSPFPRLLADYRQLLAEKSLDEIVRRFPIRESSMRTAVARALRFQTPEDYEAAVRSLLREDEILHTKLQATAGRLP